MDAWYRFYPEIQGIFLDEQASSVEQIDYYVARPSAFANARGR